MDERTTEEFSWLLLHFYDFSDKIRGKQTLECKNFDLLLQDSLRFDMSDGPSSLAASECCCCARLTGTRCEAYFKIPANRR